MRLFQVEQEASSDYNINPAPRRPAVARIYASSGDERPSSHETRNKDAARNDHAKTQGSMMNI